VSSGVTLVVFLGQYPCVLFFLVSTGNLGVLVLLEPTINLGVFVFVG